MKRLGKEVKEKAREKKQEIIGNEREMKQVGKRRGHRNKREKKWMGNE